MISNSLPKSLQDNPRLDRWLAFRADGSVLVSVGKVEIGQGVTTALAMIAAEELDVPLERLEMRPVETGVSPDEGTTSGSMSIEMSGSSLRLVCAETRALFLAAAAAKLGCSAAALDVVDGAFVLEEAATGESYASLRDVVSLARDATGGVSPKPVSRHRLVGTMAKRLDLPWKLAGGGFMQDFALPGMLHARVLRQPREGAVLAGFRTRAGVEVVRKGAFVAFVSASETEARLAWQNAAADWQGGAALSPAMAEAEWLVGQATDDRVWGAPVTTGGRRIRRRYTRPYGAHASMAPSCAVARFVDGRLDVWTHSQAIFPVRGMIAKILGLKAEAVTLHHVPGAGTYGHSGADDAAIDAALVATLRPGAPVRVFWTREDELAFEPYGPSMLIEIEAELDAAGRPVDWTCEFWSGQHISRASLTATALAVRAMPDAPPIPDGHEGLEPFPGAGVRNCVPTYDIPATRFVHHLVKRTPVRTSSLRGLGALAHVFAAESFVDELAEMAGADPVAYRLAMLTEPRARAVIEAVAEMSNWAARGEAGTGVGLGVAFARYKTKGGLAAVVAEVEVDAGVRLKRMWIAGDGGLAIAPDGVAAQLEGGAIQAASWTLKEQVTMDAEGVTSRDWESYPILRFSEIPEVSVRVMPSEAPPMGMGEASCGPAAAAIANAVAHALGARVRGLPLTRERVAGALLQ